MIDSHTHVWTDDKVAYPRLQSSRDYSPLRFTPEDFFRHASPAGVRRVVLIQMSFYGFDNSYMLDVMRARPGVFAGVARVDSSSAAPDVAMKALKTQGVRGFRIVSSDSTGSWLDDPGMNAMWECGRDESLLMCPIINPPALPMVERMCDRHPDSRVVIDHLGRVGITGQIEEQDVRALCAMARHRNVFVKVSAFYGLGRKQAPYHDLIPMVRRTFDAFGPERLMWGSDCPFQVQSGHSYKDSIDLVQGLPFATGSDKRRLLEGTAESLFFA